MDTAALRFMRDELCKLADNPSLMSGVAMTQGGSVRWPTGMLPAPSPTVGDTATVGKPVAVRRAPQTTVGMSPTPTLLTTPIPKGGTVPGAMTVPEAPRNVAQRRPVAPAANPTRVEAASNVQSYENLPPNIRKQIEAHPLVAGGHISPEIAFQHMAHSAPKGGGYLEGVQRSLAPSGQRFLPIPGGDRIEMSSINPSGTSLGQQAVRSGGHVGPVPQAGGFVSYTAPKSAPALRAAEHIAPAATNAAATLERGATKAVRAPLSLGAKAGLGLGAGAALGLGALGARALLHRRQQQQPQPVQ